AQPEALVIPHEEQLVSAADQVRNPDRTAERKPELVPPEWARLRCVAAEGTGEGVQLVVAKELPHGAMVGVGTAFGRHVHLPDASTEFRRIDAALNLELLQRVDRRQ